MTEEEHSIDAEPHLRQKNEQRDPKKTSVRNEPALGATPLQQSDEETAYHNVWDEPWAMRSGLAIPGDRINYARWYQARLATVSPLTAWTVCAFVALVGGLLAIAGTFASYRVMGASQLLAVVVIGPIVEEFMKITAVAVVLERRPYLFPHALVLFGAVAMSALTFAVVENLLYLNVYVDNPSPTFIRWRWSVCTFMHVGATLIAGLGLRRMWTNSRATFTKPTMKDAYPYVLAAVTLHGGYNLLAFLYEGAFHPF